jgi:hypothetical protein
MVGQLGRLGNLLNQAIRAVNAGRLAPGLAELIGETNAMLAEYREALLS